MLGKHFTLNMSKKEFSLYLCILFFYDHLLSLSSLLWRFTPSDACGSIVLHYMNTLQFTSLFYLQRIFRLFGEFCYLLLSSGAHMQEEFPQVVKVGMKLPCRVHTNSILLGNTTMFSKWLHYFTYTPTYGVQKFLLLHILIHILYYQIKICQHHGISF